MRVTVDQDNSERLALMAFFNMRARYETTPTMWRTGHGGVHLIVRDIPLSAEESLMERQLFRDDENRIWLDASCQMKPMQTLFGKKREERGAESKYRWPLDERGLLALPFWTSRFVRKNARA